MKTLNKIGPKLDPCGCHPCDQVYKDVVSRLKKAFAGVVSRIGDPLASETLIGPLHTPAAVDAYKRTVAEVVKQGGTIEFGGKVMEREGYFVEPTIVTGLPHDSPLVQSECFAPIVYCIPVPDLDTGIKYNNEVDQGLSSSLFTENMGDVFKVRNILPHDSPLVQSECFAPIVYCIPVPDLDTGIKYNYEVDQGLSSSLFTKNMGEVFRKPRRVAPPINEYQRAVLGHPPTPCDFNHRPRRGQVHGEDPGVRPVSDQRAGNGLKARGGSASECVGVKIRLPEIFKDFQHPVLRGSALNALGCLSGEVEMVGPPAEL
ncbi:hypothetical protein evm_014733 [Chilo suppressalis]|nr:hypothetical protein evm_014733 [Chilo suppressalis]